jgi:glycosyltransferase involved in cell wall biosynthesis
MRNVVIYRSELLRYSETFIARQAAAMRRYLPVFAGARHVPGSLSLPARSMTVADGNSVLDRARRAAFFALGYAPDLKAALQREYPALLHAHFAPDAAEALPLARVLGLPMIVTLHGYDVMADDSVHRQTRRGRIYLSRREELLRSAKLFLCVSEAVRDKALERGFPAGRIEVLPIGVDLQCYKVAERRTPSPVSPVTPISPIILFVGRLVEKKGCVHLVRAMSRVRAEIPGAQLVIIGDGPERARLRIEASIYAPGTRFLGVQSAGEVQRQMAGSRVLAVPSIRAQSGDAEGLPTVVGEALASGLPVAGFRSSGIPELVRHGIEGCLSEEGDEAGLARNLILLCRNDDLAAAMGEAGRRRVEERFNIAVLTSRLEDIYDELLGRTRTVPQRAGAGLDRISRQLRQRPANSHPVNGVHTPREGPCEGPQEGIGASCASGDEVAGNVARLTVLWKPGVAQQAQPATPGREHP